MRLARLLAWIVVACGVETATAQEFKPIPLLPAPAESLVPANPVEQAPGANGEGSSCGRFWAEADYLVYWFKPVCLTVPTITAGSPSDPQPGVPGQPHTLLAQGLHKFEFDGASGIRPRVGAWLTEDPFLGVEAEGFVLEQVAAGSPVVTSNGSPATFLVFQNPDNTRATLPFSIPGVVNASSAAVGSTQLWGLESNLAVHVATERGCWKLHATGLFGCRYLNLEDRDLVTNRQTLVGNPAVTAIGQADFTTRNQFVGGQIGSRLGLERGPVALDLTMKLALGETHLVSDVAGSPLLGGSSVLPPLVPGPLLALPSNVGQSSSNRVTVIPEINLRLRWQASDRVSVTLGYNLLYWNRILCPGDQMDPLVNTTELPGRGPVVGPPAPTPRFVFTDAFAQGLEAGVGFSF